jgi:hypothetical protein
MLRSVNLDNQPSCQTGKVCNVGTNHGLPSEMTSFHVKLAKMTPENCFGIRTVGP